MPLSPPAERQAIHTRRIECTSYRRADGAWDVEGHLTDTVSYDFPNEFRGTIHAGEAIHDMWIRLVVDADIVVQDVEAVTDAGPYAICPAIAPAFAKLKGARIGPGFSRLVRERLGGVNGCTHIVDLLRPVATVAFKTVRRAVKTTDDPAHAGADDGAHQVNTCHALASDGEIVRRRWPDRYTGR